MDLSNWRDLLVGCYSVDMAMNKTNFIFATGDPNAISLKHQDRRFVALLTVTERQQAGQESTVTRARNQILQRLASDGVFQFRHYTYRTRHNTPEVRYRTLRTAVEQLNEEGRLRIMFRRPFGRVFDDGTTVGGVRITAVPSLLEEERDIET